MSVSHILDLFARSLAGVPAYAWPLAPFALILLGAAAVIDARTGRVPDPLIFLGLLVTTAARGFVSDWQTAANYLMLALASGIVIWGVNQAWYMITKRDAIGMGDGKWTMLAVDVFGIGPALGAWFAGAWIALIWMALAWIARRKITRVYLAPFLFAGLLAGIWWLRLR